MKKKFKLIILSTAFLGMGIALPSCPGQQELQQKVDTLQITQTELNRKLQALTNQLNVVTTDMGQVKQTLPQMISIITGIKTSNDKLTADLLSLQHPAKKAAYSIKKKGH